MKKQVKFVDNAAERLKKSRSEAIRNSHMKLFMH